MTTGPPRTASAVTADIYGGRMPSHAGDFAVETHGIAPVPVGNRYGTAGRLFTVWFAPQINLTVVFSGTLAIALGLGFWLGLLAMVIGTVIGAFAVGYLSTWGPRTGTAQLPNARMAFGQTVAVVAVIQWLSAIAWGSLAGLFGGDALAELLGIPFWAGVLIVLAAQGIIGVFGYELIHRVQAVMTVVLTVIFTVFAVKLAGGHEFVSAPTAAGADLAGAFMLEVAIALSLSISWASYASDYSRYLPADISRTAVFSYTFAGLTTAYVAVQAIGIAAAGVLTDQTVLGMSSVMGGGVLGALTLVVIGLGTATSNALNDYSGSLALQTVGLRIRRPVSAVLVVVLTFTLIMWLHSGDLARRFEGVLLFVSYWVPAFVAIVVIDWRRRSAGCNVINPAEETTSGADAWAALVVFAVAFAAAVPFMHNNLIDGVVAVRLHGADLAYFVNFAVAAVLYCGYHRTQRRRATAPL